MSRLPKLLLVSTALIALAACRDEAKRPPAALAVTTPVADLPLAPEGAALTMGPPAPVGRLAPANYNYAWAERAYAVDRALYAARPDYEFEYDGIEPWAWETEDDWTLYAEPLETGYRYYYYEPGEDYPYFVRDPDYGYGYDDGGRLVTVYTIAGRLLSPDYLYDRAPIAGRYWTRGMDLRRAAYRAPHRPIEDAIWREREPVFVRTQEVWTRAADEQPQWRDYRRRDGERDLRRLEPERHRRETIMARYQPQDRDDLQWRPERREKDRDHGRRSFAEANGPDVDRFRLGDHEGRRMEREARAQDDRREARDHGRWGREQQFADQDRRNRQEAQDRGRRDHEQRFAQDQDRRNRQEAQDRGGRDHEQRLAQDQDRRDRQEAQDRGRRDHEQRMAQDQDRRNRQEAQDRGRRDHEQRMAQDQDRRNRQEAQDRGRRDREQQAAQDQDRRNRQEAQDRGRRDREQQMAQQQDRGNGRADRGGQDQAQQADRHGGGKRGGDQATDAGKAGRDAADREKGHGGGKN